MAKLTAAARRNIPTSEFALPEERKFPIPDRSHAANAKSRAAAQGGEVERKVDAAVARKFPSMKSLKKSDVAKAAR